MRLLGQRPFCWIIFDSYFDCSIYTLHLGARLHPLPAVLLYRPVSFIFLVAGKPMLFDIVIGQLILGRSFSVFIRNIRRRVKYLSLVLPMFLDELKYSRISQPHTRTGCIKRPRRRIRYGRISWIYVEWAFYECQMKIEVNC